MLAILAYAIGIMYSPGPVNLLGLHCGLKRQTIDHLAFFAGVGSAMLVMFLTLGYLGREVVPLWFLPYLSSLGCGYILYIAWKVLNSDVVVSRDCAPDAALNFRDGFLMQLLNPKGIVATLPIATIQFPSEGIVGIQIAFWSLLLSLLAFGAPTCYAAVGSVLGKWITRPQVFKLVNMAMAMLLVYVVITLGYTNVYQPLYL